MIRVNTWTIDRSMANATQQSPSTLLICGLPESGKLRVQRRDGQPTTLRDVFGGPELLYATPQPPPEAAGLAAALPHLCMPDGVAVRDEPPPPPRFFTTSLPGTAGDGAASAHLACCLFYEEIPAERMMPQLQHAMQNTPPDTPRSPTRTPTQPGSPHSTAATNTPSAFASPARASLVSEEPPSQWASNTGCTSSERSVRRDVGMRPKPPPEVAVGGDRASMPPSPLPTAGHVFSSATSAAPPPQVPAPPASDDDAGVVFKRKRREDAVRELRNMGVPLGVAAVALQQAEDDVAKAKEWLQHGRGLNMLRADESAPPAEHRRPRSW